MGDGLGAEHRPRRVQIQKEEPRAGGSRARGGQGASRVEPDTQQRQVSYLRLSANPRASATPDLGIPSSCSPEPTSFSPPGQSPVWSVGAHTRPFPDLPEGALSPPSPLLPSPLNDHGAGTLGHTHTCHPIRSSLKTVKWEFLLWLSGNETN